MPTNRDIITRSLRLANIIGESEHPSAEQAQDALDSMNDMLLDWQRDGIELEYYKQSSLDNQIPLDDENLRAVRFSLAVEMLAEYGMPINDALAVKAANSYASLVRASIEIEEADMSHLPGSKRYVSGV